MAALTLSGEFMSEIEDRILAVPKWYHKIELPNGSVTPGWAPLAPEKYGLPEDLSGKRVLDVGAWDGYWTWESLKRGAREVVAIDDFSDTLGGPDPIDRGQEWETFDLCREAFGFVTPVRFLGITHTGSYGKEIIASESNDDQPVDMWMNDKNQICRRLTISLYDIQPKTLGTFDIVLFFGTIYHLRYPLLAIDILSKICNGAIYIESAVCDDYSPYRGGINKGYAKNDMVMEFYPGNEYGNNKSNWWVPTLQCLGAMLASVGFINIDAWPLTEKPEGLSACRGFVFGSKKEKADEYLPTVVHPEALEPLKVAAVMSIPRLGFQDNSFCAFEALIPLGIHLYKIQGAYWEQCIERGIQTEIDDTNADAILTIDYDTLYKKEDIAELIRLMQLHPKADAIVAMQVGRSSNLPLLTVKGKSGQVAGIVPHEVFDSDLTKIATGHFGLTLLRATSLLKLPHPWFRSVPDSDNQWGPCKIDADISFWKLMEKHNMTVYSANHVIVGHCQLMSAWPDKNFGTIYQHPEEYHNGGPPVNARK